MVNQKQIFLDGEADNWFTRNKKNIKIISVTKNRMMINFIKQLLNRQNSPKKSFLEVGCANGEFLLIQKK